MSVPARSPAQLDGASAAGRLPWPPGSGPRILVADGWFANAGDGAIVLAMARSLERVIPGVRLLFCAPHRRLVERHYPSLTFVDPLADLLAARPDLAQDADAVISKGGGHLFEHYPNEARFGAYGRLAELGVPLAFYAQSVGWWVDPALRARLAASLESARIVVVRDPESAEHIDRMRIRPRATAVTVDEALMLPIGSTSPPGPDAGVSLNALARTPVAGAAEPAPDGLAVRHAEIVERLAATHPAVRACSTVQGFSAVSDEIEDDALHHARVRDLLSSRAAKRFEVIEGFLPPDRLRAAFRGLDVLVSARLHAALLAMLEGVPAVYVSSNFKGVSLFRRLGLEHLVVEDSDPAEVMAALERARDERASLPRRLAGMRRVARTNAPLVAEALGFVRGVGHRSPRTSRR